MDEASMHPSDQSEAIDSIDIDVTILNHGRINDNTQSLVCMHAHPTLSNCCFFFSAN
jgi:hypothetical protein